MVCFLKRNDYIMKNLNNLGHKFTEALSVAVSRQDSVISERQRSKKVHVTGAGRTLTFAYEQLRNAAEYAEDHLLQYAIKRFYNRVFLSRDGELVKNSGEELIVELTMAGYLQNDTVNTDTIVQINNLAFDYYNSQLKYGRDSWGLDILSVEVEQLLLINLKRDIFAHFVYEYFLKIINPKKAIGYKVQNFEILLFVAVYRILFKFDDSAVRSVILKRYQQKPSLSSFRQTNEMIDKVLVSKSLDKITRLVNRQSAPFRILWKMVDRDQDVKQLFNSRENFLSLFKQQIDNEYGQIEKRINKGIIKSVIFLIITKILIGIAIEVPYDFAMKGVVSWLPLTINLLFPPIFMVLLRFTLQLPSNANEQSLIEIVDNLIYGDDQSIAISKQPRAGLGTKFNIAYALFSVLVFGGIALLLYSIGFEWLHLIVFYVFLSAASFLGFRLSRIIREVEIGEGQQSGIAIVRDFFYLPFVIVGRWISEKYAQVNIVALILDVVIELPLKTILHLIRQWGIFIANKKDEI